MLSSINLTIDHNSTIKFSVARHVLAVVDSNLYNRIVETEAVGNYP